MVRVTATPETTQLASDPLTDNPDLPVQLIQYVQHTREILVLDGLDHDLPIVDTYLHHHPHRSMLFLPLLHQTKLIGLLYLEHQSVAGVFSRDRITILNFLCTQAAISLENALLNQILEQKLDIQTAKRQASENCLHNMVSDRKRLEKEKDRLIQILQATPDFIGICQPANGILWQNQSFRTLRPDLNILEEQVQISELYPQMGLRHR